MAILCPKDSHVYSLHELGVKITFMAIIFFITLTTIWVLEGVSFNTQSGLKYLLGTISPLFGFVSSRLSLQIPFNDLCLSFFFTKQTSEWGLQGHFQYSWWPSYAHKTAVYSLDESGVKLPPSDLQQPFSITQIVWVAKGQLQYSKCTHIPIGFTFVWLC